MRARRRADAPPRGAAVIRLFAAFIAWNVGASLGLVLLPPLAGLGLILLLTAAFAWGFLLRGGRPGRRAIELRIRPLRGPALRWTLVAVPLFLLFNWSLGELYIRLVPVPPATFNPFAGLMDDPISRLTITVMAVAIAPLLEELVFRGAIQRSLERRWGAARGLLATSLVFATIHFLPWVFPLHFFLGLAFGWAVYATRSIWSGVILHAANNTAAVLGLQLQADEPTEPVPTLWTTGITVDWWQALAAAAVTGVLLAAVAREVWKARPEPALRPSGADA